MRQVSRKAKKMGKESAFSGFGNYRWRAVITVEAGEVMSTIGRGLMAAGNI